MSERRFERTIRLAESRPMRNDADSLQEAMLRELADHSFAAEYVFAPDTPRRLKNEPADLVWACNNCIILMYMTGGRAIRTHSGGNKYARKRSGTT
jgi:hypothetical protein